MKISTATAALMLCGAAWGQTQSKGLTVEGSFNKYIAAGELAKDVWGYSLPDGKEFALLSWTHGLSVLNVSNPKAITEVAFIKAPTTNWKTVKVYKHYAYLGTDNGGKGLQIIDLAGLPNSVKELPAYTGSGFGSTHNIWIDTDRGLLYATGVNGQNWTIHNLADPEKPAQIYNTSGESHDFHTRGKYMYMGTGRTNTTNIYDVTDPKAPQRVGAIRHPGGNTYVHNSALTRDGNHLFTTEEVEAKSMKVWDIRNLATIPMVDEYLVGPPQSSIAHNVYTKGDTAYVSHYGQGFRVLDISNPANLREFAFYQPQYPSQHPPLLFGSFGAYVFLPSGNLLSSDATLGLFILKLSPAPVSISRKEMWRDRRFDFSLGFSGGFRLEILEDGKSRTYGITGRRFVPASELSPAR